MTIDVTDYKRADFQSAQEVRWCPGCGDYTILATVQTFLAEMGIARENHVFISGIGCSSRFPYYVDTYGMHGIHGRAPAIASGVASANPDLTVWVITGDGDGLSIGGNHLIHALRRNVNLKILLFNNQIYGLTKGQYSPTSELGKKTKTSPMGSIDFPFNPVSLALGAEATFVARTIDMDRKHMAEVLAAAAEHRGTSFIEIYQNCNVFNDKAFIELTSRETRDDNRVYLEHGKPIVFGPDDEYGIRIGHLGAEIVEVSAVGIDAIQVHNAKDPEPGVAFALSRLSRGPHGPTPLGIFRDVDRAVYEDLMVGHINQAQELRGTGDLAALLRSGGSWTAERETDSPS